MRVCRYYRVKLTWMHQNLWQYDGLDGSMSLRFWKGILTLQRVSNSGMSHWVVIQILTCANSLFNNFAVTFLVIKKGLGC